MLEKRGVKVDKVLNFAIDDAILEERITGRWIHPSSGRTYHTKFAPPKAPGADDVINLIFYWCCKLELLTVFSLSCLLLNSIWFTFSCMWRRFHYCLFYNRELWLSAPLTSLLWFLYSYEELILAVYVQVTGEPLIQRKDDTAAVLKSRLEAFHKQTEPVCLFLPYFCDILVYTKVLPYCCRCLIFFRSC